MGLQNSCWCDEDSGLLLLAAPLQQAGQVPEVDVILAGGRGQPVPVAARGTAAQVVRVECKALDQLIPTNYSGILEKVGNSVLNPDPELFPGPGSGIISNLFVPDPYSGKN